MTSQVGQQAHLQSGPHAAWSHCLPVTAWQQQRAGRQGESSAGRQSGAGKQPHTPGQQSV